jgi:lipooligosaccharide transport system ATP-binding protein
MSTSDSAIRLRGVVKRFGALTAVDGLDLDVPYGSCVGLLGPNGAGKSTTMKALTAQVIADAGEITILGYALPGDSKQARAEMGVVPQLDNLDTALTVEQNLLVFTHLYRVPSTARRRAIDRALEIANLRDRRTSKVDELSGGMRRRLLIARALLHRPRLLLLDEPTEGIQPSTIKEIGRVLRKLLLRQITIVLVEQYLDFALELAEHCVVLSRGEIVMRGKVAELDPVQVRKHLAV